MDFNTYQKLAQKTANESLSRRERLSNAALGLAGEAGEFADQLKKHLHQGHPLDEAKLVNELGDILWYCAEAAAALGITLEEAAAGNVDKLRTRYPEGFSTEASLARVDTASDASR